VKLNMSKIGQKPINISAGVNLQINEGLISVKGPKGEWKGTLPRVLELKNKNNQWIVSRKNEKKPVSPYTDCTEP